MGFWGSSLYANDTTSDVRDTYMSYLVDQLSDQEAYDKIMEKVAEYLEDEDEEPLVWYALADTQWKVGRLLPEVKEKALYWIERKGGLEPWLDTPSKGKGWLKTLEKLREKLNSPMPMRKNVRHPVPINTNPWNLYDVYAYQCHGKYAAQHGIEGKYIVLHKIGEDVPPYDKDIAMRLQVFDKLFDTIPTLEELNGIRILPLDSPKRVNLDQEPIYMSRLFVIPRKSHYPKKYLTYIGNNMNPANNMLNRSALTWWDLDDSFVYFHHLWKKVQYETIGDGIFRYLPEERTDNA